jgi:hypothetical protein
VLRAVGETGATQENIRDWLELNGGDSGFQLLTEEEKCCNDIFLFSSALPTLLNFPLVS